MISSKLHKIFSEFGVSKENVIPTYIGIIGLGNLGNLLVNVPDRPDYVYVRIGNNTSEAVHAYNDRFTLIYGQPVFVQRDVNNWKIIGIVTKASSVSGGAGAIGGNNVYLMADTNNFMYWGGTSLRLYADRKLVIDITNAPSITVGAVATENIIITSSAIQIRDATTVYTELAAGVLTLGEVGGNKDNIVISAGAFAIRNNVTERVGMTAAGILTIKDSTGAAVITLDAAAGAEITKKLTMPGASSAIAIGVVPPTSAALGTGIWIDRTGIYGLAANVVQAKFDAVTGAITAGAGSVILDINGCTIVPDDIWYDTRAYRIATPNGATIYGAFGGYISGNHAYLTIKGYSVPNQSCSLMMRSYAPAGRVANTKIAANSADLGPEIGIDIAAADSDSTSYIHLFNGTVNIDRGLNVGAVSGAGVGGGKFSGELDSITAGTNLKSTLKTYFDGLYSVLAHDHSRVNGIPLGSFAWGGSTYDTGISINAGYYGQNMLLLASCHWASGVNSASAVYSIWFAYDGNNTPVATYLGGSLNFITVGKSAGNTLTLTDSGSYLTHCSYFLSK